MKVMSELALSEPLFRPEAIIFQRQRLWGEALVLPSLSSQALTMVAVVIVVAGVIFLALNHYAAKESVRGYLRAQHGVIKVQSPLVGQLVSIDAAAGSIVKAGARLGRVATERRLRNGEAVSDVVLAQLSQQRAQLQSDIESEANRAQLEQARIDERLTRAAEAARAAQEEQARRAQQLHLSDLENDKIARLVARGSLARTQLDVVQSQRLDRASALAEIEERLAALAADRRELLLQRQQLPIESAGRLSLLRQRLLELHAKEAELTGQSEVVLTAPRDGRVGDWLADVGSQVNSNRTLVTLMDASTPIEAVLLVPSRSIGFLAPGQEVRLRYEAFPHQRYGVFRATLTHVDRALLLPNEIDDPIALNEPVFRVRAQLNDTSVRAYGREIRLKPGLVFDADIVVDRRSLIEWLLDPLLSLRGMT